MYVKDILNLLGLDSQCICLTSDFFYQTEEGMRQTAHTQK